MKHKQKLVDQVYDREPETGDYIINIVINRYEDIFNNLDPAPFKRRDLNSDLIRFLEDCSSDIPLKNKIILQFQLPAPNRNENMEALITKGLRTYFSFIMNTFSRKIRLTNERSLFFVVISFLLLLIASFMANFDTADIFYLTLNEGIFIGGWVFMWEAISSSSIKKREIRNQFRQYKRFFGSKIQFRTQTVF